MGNDVETRATPEQLAARLIGLALIVAAALTWATLALYAEWMREFVFAPLAGWSEAGLAAALAQDAAALWLSAGVLLLGRPWWLTLSTAGVVVLSREIEHLDIAWPSISLRRLFGVSMSGIHLPHLAWSLAIGAATARMLAIVAPAGARRARDLAIAWPIAAMASIAASLGAEGPIALSSRPENLLRLATAVAEAGLAAVTLALAAVAAQRLFALRRDALRRRAAGLDPIAADDRDGCARCGYDLTGLADAAACPECGLGVERSRTASPDLRDAPPTWLRRIALGAALALVAHVVMVVWPFGFEAWVLPRIVVPSQGIKGISPGGSSFAFTMPNTAIVGPTLFGFPVDPLALRFAPSLAASVVLAVGLWLISRRDRREPRDVVLRRSLRTLACVPFVATLTLYLNAADGGRWRDGSRAVELAAIALLTLGSAPIPGLTFALLHRLARRALNANLAEHAAIVGVGYVVALVTWPLAFAYADANDRGNWGARSDAIVYVLAGITVALIFFAGWATLTLGRCAVAFARAGRAARARWAAADRGRIGGHGEPDAGRLRVSQAD